jgi:GTP cyclohydrolase III
MWRWLAFATAPQLAHELAYWKDVARVLEAQNKSYAQTIAKYLKGERIMGNIAQAGLDQLVDVVDNTSAAAIVAVQATVDAAAATATAAINVGDKTLDVALEEAEGLRAQYVASLRKITDAVAGVGGE